MQGFACVYITISVGVRNACPRQILRSFLLITQLTPDIAVHARRIPLGSADAHQEHGLGEHKGSHLQMFCSTAVALWATRRTQPTARSRERGWDVQDKAL